MDTLPMVVGVAALCFVASGFCLGYSLGWLRAKNWYQQQLMTDMRDMEWYLNRSNKMAWEGRRDYQHKAPWGPRLFDGGKSATVTVEEDGGFDAS